MTNNEEKAIFQDHNTPNVFTTLLMVFCGITVIYLLGII